MVDFRKLLHTLEAPIRFVAGAFDRNDDNQKPQQQQKASAPTFYKAQTNGGPQFTGPTPQEQQQTAPVDTSYAKGATDKVSNVIGGLVRGAVGSEQQFAKGIARILPGGTADIDANNKMSEESSQRVTRIMSLYKQKKISQAQAKQLLANEVQTSDQAVANLKDIQKDMPTPAQVGLGALGTGADILTAGLLPGGKLALAGGSAAAGGLNAAAQGGSTGEVAKNAVLGAALPLAPHVFSAGAQKILNKVPDNVAKLVSQEKDPAAVTQILKQQGIKDADIQKVTNELPKGDIVQPNAPDSLPNSAPNGVPGTPTPNSPAVQPQAGLSAAVSNSPVPEPPQVGKTGNVVNPEQARPIANATPEVQSAADQVVGQLKAATDEYKSIAKTRSQAKAQRLGAGEGAYQAAGGGVQGVKAKLSQLRGSYESGKLPPIEIPDAQKTALHDFIENSPDLKGFEKLNTQVALAKVTGDLEGHLRPSEITYLRKAFGQDFADTAKAAVDASITPLGKARQVFDEVTGLPRALMSTLDFSFGGRQGLVLGSRYPKEWLQANRDSFRYAFDKNYFDNSMSAIENSPEFSTITDKMKIALPGIDSDAKALEHFGGTGLAEKIPVAGKAVAGSGRAYDGGLTKLRYDVAKKIIDSYGGTDAFLKFFDGNEKAMQSLGEFINTASGRGGKAGGLLDKDRAGILSNTLFSPRLWASRLNTLNPYYYYRLDPAARKLALQTGAAFATTAGTVLAIASNLPGVTVEWDPRSADFAKIKVGNTRYDILGGLQQNIRTAAQLITGTKIDSTTGEPQTLGPDRGFGKPSRKDILYQMFENKENPLLAFATTLMEGSDPAGNPINPATEAAKLAIPLNVQGVYDTTKDTGNILKGAAMNLPGVFGVGVQTYGNTKTKDQKPGAAVDLATKIKNAKTDSTKQTQDFIKSLSPDEQTLIKADDKTLKGLVKDGTIDQGMYTQIKGLQQVQKNLKGVDIPDGVTSDTGTAFYKKYNSLTDTGQKNYLKGPADANSKKITDMLNSSKPDGLPDLKASNQLAKLYSDYEKDLNNHPDYTDIDKSSKAKSFYTAATKMQFSDVAQDMYTKGSSTDGKQLLKSGTVSREQLDEAVKLDDTLYSAGLTSSLKFSKAFRKAGGYGVPSGPYDEDSGTSTKKEKTVNAHLSDFLISGGSKVQAPPKFKSNAKVTVQQPILPSSTGKPKININL